MIRRKTLMGVSLYPEFHRTLKKQILMPSWEGDTISDNKINAYHFCSLVQTINSWNPRVCSRIVNFPIAEVTPLGVQKELQLSHCISSKNCDTPHLEAAKNSPSTYHFTALVLSKFVSHHFQAHCLSSSTVSIAEVVFSSAHKNVRAFCCWHHVQCCQCRMSVVLWMLLSGNCEWRTFVDSVWIPKLNYVFRIENLTVYKPFSVAS